MSANYRFGILHPAVRSFAGLTPTPRILNIFEGAAEIQAQVVCRGLIEGRN